MAREKIGARKPAEINPTIDNSLSGGDAHNLNGFYDTIQAGDGPTGNPGPMTNTNAYFSLAGGSFSQNWSNAGLITTNDDWSGVPSIVGFRGDGLAGTTGVDPRTITGNDSPGVVDVNANQTNPNTFATGGVTEFDLTDDTIAIFGSGTARAPYIVIYLDATNCSNIRFQCNLRDIDGSVDNAIQPIAIQYRTSPTGTWTNATGGYFADVTTGPSLATAVQAVNLLLGADANNAATLEIRIMTTDALGNDEAVGIDDIQVSAVGALAINDVSHSEGSGTNTTYSFTVTRSGGSAGAVDVDWAVSFPGGAGIADASDFTGATSGTLNFLDGQTSKTITVTVTGDLVYEPNETFTINLTNATNGATISDSSGLGTITNDDAPVPPAVDLNGSDPGIDYTGGSYLEGTGPAMPIGSNIAVTQGTLPITGATITITDPLAGDALNVLSLPASIVVSSGAGTSTLVLTGVGATTGDWEFALAVVRYSTSSDNPDNYGTDAQRTITVTLTDGVAPGAAATATLGIAALNDAPVLGGLDGDSVTFTEGDPYVVLDNHAPVASVSDPDNATFAGGFVQVGIQSGGTADDEFFVLDGFPGVDVVNGADVFVDGVWIGSISNGGPGQILRIDLNSGATAARVATLLDYIAFRNGSENPLAGDRQVSWLLNDGNGDADVALSTVTVTAVDDPPAVFVPASDVTYTEQQGAVTLDASLSLTDPDAPTTLAGATVTILTGYVASDDLLTWDNALASSLQIIGDFSNGVLTFTGDGSAADYQALLRTVGYDNTGGNVPVAGDREIQFAVSAAPGNVSLSNAGAVTEVAADANVTLHVAAVNDTPVPALAASYSATEQVPLDLKDTVSFSDVDVDNGNVTITLSVGFGILTASAGFTGVTVDGSNSALLTVTGTAAQLSMFFYSGSDSTLAYTANGDAPPSSTLLSFSVNDNGNTGGNPETGSTSATINITGTPDAALISGSDTGSVTEDGGPLQTASGVLFANDPDMDLTGFQNSDQLGTYGTFELQSSGFWGYTLNNNAANVQALHAGQQAFDVFTVHSADGTAHDVTITVNGAAELPTIDLDGPGGDNDYLAATFVEGSLAGVAIADSDVDIVSIEGVITDVTVTITDYHAGDIFFLSTANPTVHEDISYNFLTPGVVHITGGGAAQAADFEQALSYLRYRSSSTDPAFDLTAQSRTLSFTVTDAGGTSMPAATTIIPIDSIESLTLGNLVFLDRNYNGVFDTGDTGIDGVTVQLRDTGNNILATTTSAGGGFYSFTGLSAGNYIVTTTGGPAAGYFALTGTDPNDNVDNDSNYGGTITLTEGDEPGGDVNNTYDLGFQAAIVDLNGAGAGLDFAGTATEQVPDGAIGSNIVVTTPAPLTGIFITITNPQGGDGLDVYGTLPSGITIAAGAGSTQLVLIATDPNAVSNADWAAALELVRYSNGNDNPDLYGTAPTRTITVQPVASPNNPGLVSVATLTLQPVDDAPAVDLNGGAAGTGTALAYTENGAPILLAPAAAFSDVDNNNFRNGSITVTITSGGIASDHLNVINNGLITLSTYVIRYQGVDIATYTEGGTDGLTPMVIQLLDVPQVDSFAVQALLRALAYDNTGEDPGSAQRVISVVLNDGDGGNSAPVFATVDVTPVNDAPLGADRALTFDQDTVHIFAFSEFGYHDADNNNPTFVRIVTIPATGSLQLNGADVHAGDDVLVSEINAGHLTYTPAANAGGANYANFTFRVADDGGTANGGVDIDPVANTISFNATTLDYTENQGESALAPYVVVDPLGNYRNGTITLTLTSGGAAEDRLTVFQNLGITLSTYVIRYQGVDIATYTEGGTDGLTPMVIQLLDVAAVTPAAVQALLRVLSYHDVSEDPSTTRREFTITLDDGHGHVGPAASGAVLVTNVDDLPFAQNSSASGAEDGGRIAFTPTGSDADDPIDHFTLTQLTVHGSLYTTSSGGSPLTFPSSVPAVSGGATLWYEPDPNYFGSDSVRYVAVSDSGMSSEATVSLTVTSVDDAPTSTNLSGDIATFTEGQGRVFIDVGGNAVLADIDTPEFHNGQMRVIIMNARPNDVLSFVYKTVYDGTGIFADLSTHEVMFGNELLGIFSGGTNGEDLVFSWIYSPDSAQVSEIIRALTFETTGDNPSTVQREIALTMYDGQSVDAILTVLSAVNVVGVNDAPEGIDHSLDFRFDRVHVFTLAEFSYTDAENDDLLSVTIATLPSLGTIRLNNVAISANDVISAADIAGGLLTYEPAAGASVGDGYTSFTYIVRDDGGVVGPGAADTDDDANTITIDLVPNRAPVFGAGTITGSASELPDGDANEGTQVDDRTGSIAFTDADTADAHSVGFTPGGVGYFGTFGTSLTETVGSGSGSVGWTWTATDADLDSLRAGQVVSQTYTITIDDGEGGTDSEVVTITLSGANDAPVIDAGSIAAQTVTDTAGNDVFSDLTGTITATDPDIGDTHNFSLVGGSLGGGGIWTKTSAYGTLSLNALTGAYSFSVNNAAVQSLVNDDQVSFAITVTDGSAATDTKILTINLDGTNDNPDLAAAGPVAEIDTADDDNFPDVTGTLSATDRDAGDGSTFSITGGSVSSDPGYTYEKAGTYGTLFVNTTSGAWKFVANDAAIEALKTNQSETFQLIAADTHGGTGAQILTINVTGVNDAPSGSNGSATFNEDTSYTFSGADFGFTDPEGGALLSVFITTLPATGTLRLAGNLVSVGQEIPAGQIGNLVFTPAPNANGNGYASFTFQVRDDGGTANGGVDTDQSANTFTLNVTPVNDAPAIDLNGAAGGTGSFLTYTENAPGTPLAPAATVVDVDMLDFDNGTLTVATTFGATADDVVAPIHQGNGAGQIGISGQSISYGGIGIGSFTGGTGGTNLVITFNANASQAAVQALLRDIGFAVNSENPGGGRTIRFTLTDGDGGTSNNANANVTVLGINDAPSGTDHIATLTEDGSYALTRADFGFSDPAEGHAFIAVTITTLPANGTLYFDADGPGGNPPTPVVADAFILTSAIDAGRLTFVPAPNGNGTNYTSFTFQVVDAGGTANGGQDTDQSPNLFTFDVTGVNDAPVNSVPLTTQDVNEDGSLTFGNANPISVSDVDSGAEDVTVTLTVQHGTLEVGGNAGLTDLTGDGSATVSITGTVAEVNNALNGLIYRPDANYHGSDTLQIVTSDNGNSGTGGALSDTDTVAINVVSVNDAPAGTDKAVTINEDGSYVFAVADFGFTDPSDSPANSLQAVTFTTLPSNGTLYYDADGAGTGAAVAVTAGQSIFASEIALGKLSFVPTADASGSPLSSFTFQVQDDGGTTNGGVDLDQSANTFTINVSAVNDAPVNSVPVPQSVNEDGSLVLSYAFGNAIQVADIDAGSGEVSVTLSVAHGILTVSVVSGISFTGSNGSASFTISGTVAAVNQALGDGLTYEPAANYNGSDAISVQTSDNGNTGPGPAGTDSDSVAITVNSVNDAPVGTDTTVSGSEDDPYAFTAADFGFSDPDDTPANAFAGVVIASLPAVGQLLLNNSAVSVGDFITLADINSGLLTFQPVADQFGDAYASFTFQVRDDGGTASSGLDTDQIANTMTIDIAPDNVAPVVDLDGVAAGVDYSTTFTEDSAAIAIGSSLSVSDGDAGIGDMIESAVVTLTDAVAGDSLTILGTLPTGINAVTTTPAGQIVITLTGTASQADYQTALGQIRYVTTSQDPDFGGTDLTRTITVTANDGLVNSAVATATINIAAVNDAAVAQPDAFTITESGSISGGDLFASNGSGADGDVDGPALAISAVNGSGANVGSQISLASGALLTVNSNGTFDYNPNGAFLPTPTAGSGASNTPGHDSFTYTLAGGNTVMVNINLTGLDTDDLLRGTAGADILAGGLGNDFYFIEDAADQVNEAAGQGNDRVFASSSWVMTAGSEIELLTTANHVGTTAINLTGNALAQTIYGNDGDNVLNGAGGADTMVGRLGNDWFFVDNAGDRALENAGEGNDRVFASVSWTLTAGSDVELLTTTDHAGTGAINLTGNALANTIYGNDGDNILDGAAGADILVGRLGNDWFFVDNAGDRALETVGEGNDRVFASVSYALVAGASVEILSTDFNPGTSAIDLTGNELAQAIFGNEGKNVISGGGGADSLVGFGGDDSYNVSTASTSVLESAGGGNDRVFASVSYTLTAGAEVELMTTDFHAGTAAINLTGNGLANTIYGNAGNNVLDGKGGNDSLVGLAGADTFAFTSALGAGNVDQVFGFEHGTDKIALDDAVFAAIGPTGALNANAFVTGSAAGDADDRIIYNNLTGQLLYDADGNGAGAAIQFATLQPGLTLTASDFTVI